MNFRKTLAFSLSAAALVGCSNIGDTNPISPEKMEEIRKQESNQRANFNPSMTPPPKPSTGG